MSIIKDLARKFRKGEITLTEAGLMMLTSLDQENVGDLDGLHDELKREMVSSIDGAKMGLRNTADLYPTAKQLEIAVRWRGKYLDIYPPEAT